MVATSRRQARGGPGRLPYWGMHETPADLAALQDLLEPPVKMGRSLMMGMVLPDRSDPEPP
jgi:hypothetical protein